MIFTMFLASFVWLKRIYGAQVSQHKKETSKRKRREIPFGFSWVLRYCCLGFVEVTIANLLLFRGVPFALSVVGDSVVVIWCFVSLMWRVTGSVVLAFIGGSVYYTMPILVFKLKLWFEITILVKKIYCVYGVCINNRWVCSLNKGIIDRFSNQ